MKNYKKILTLIGIIIFFFSIFEVVCYLSTTFNLGIPCIFNKVLGISCSTCGMTRAMIACSRLDFYQAIRYNAFSIPLIIIALFVFMTFCYEIVFKTKEGFIRKIPAWIWIGFIVLLLVYGIIRNIGPFTVLLPTDVTGNIY